MLDLKINGIYKLTNKIVIRPDKKCVSCLFFNDGVCWCNYLKVKVDNWEYYEKCPVIEVTIEEE